MRWLALIVAGSLLARILYVIVERGSFPSLDGYFYSVVANSVAAGDGFVAGGTPTALHPPLWSWVLSGPSRLGFDTLLSHQVVACVIGAITVALVGLAGHEIGGRRLGLLAAGLAAISPNVWVWERELAAETIVLPLVAATILLAYRFWHRPRSTTIVALGGVCGLLALARAEQVMVFPLLVVPLLVGATALPVRRRVGWLVASSALLAAVMSPWMIYNIGRFERPVLLTTSLGVNLSAANNPVAYGEEALGHIDTTFWARYDRADESISERRHLEEGLAYIDDHRGRLPVVIGARLGRTFGFFRPLDQLQLDLAAGNSSIWVYRIGLGFFWVTAPLAVLGAFRLRARRTIVFPLLVPLITVMTSTAITFGQSRFRAPAEVSLCILAAVGVLAVLRAIHERQPQAHRPADQPHPTPASVALERRTHERRT